MAAPHVVSTSTFIHLYRQTGVYLAACTCVRNGQIRARIFLLVVLLYSYHSCETKFRDSNVINIHALRLNRYNVRTVNTYFQDFIPHHFATFALCQTELEPAITFGRSITKSRFQ